MSMKKLCLGGLFALATTPATAGDLTVLLSGLHPGSPVYLRLHNTPAQFESGEAPLAKIAILATANQAKITLHDLPAGRYAAAAFQDTDQNGQLSTSFLGIPSEPYGFSNAASSADFDAAAFDVTASTTLQTLKLQD